MLNGKRIWVAGHRGMVGSAIIRRLERENPSELLTAPKSHLDLRRQSDVERWVFDKRPDVVILAAAKVGGILANDSYPVEFLYDNLMIQNNVIHAASKSKVEKLLFLGSSCIYPKLLEQPVPEEALLTGSLEPTNQWYSIAKIAGIKLCQAYRRQYGLDFITAMPTNLYGPFDRFDSESSHVLPALLRKIHEAKIREEKFVTVWGSGQPKREFLHVDDMADACIFLLNNYSASTHINVGYGNDISISDLASKISSIVGFRGELKFDISMPDGSPRKLLDSARIRRMGWMPQVTLHKGIEETYDWFVQNYDRLT